MKPSSSACSFWPSRPNRKLQSGTPPFPTGRATTMPKLIYGRRQIEALADRLMNRGTSRLMNDRPHLQADIILAAIILQRAVSVGFPPTEIEIDVSRIPSGGITP